MRQIILLLLGCASSLSGCVIEERATRDAGLNEDAGLSSALDLTPSERGLNPGKVEGALMRISIQAVGWGGHEEGDIHIAPGEAIALEVHTESSGGLGADGDAILCMSAFSHIEHTLIGDEIRLYAFDQITRCGADVMRTGHLDEAKRPYPLPQLPEGRYALMAPSPAVGQPWVRRWLWIGADEPIEACAEALPAELVGAWTLKRAFAAPAGYPQPIEMKDSGCAAPAHDQALWGIEFSARGAFSGPLWSDMVQTWTGCARPSGEGWRLDLDPALHRGYAMRPGGFGHLELDGARLIIRLIAEVQLDLDGCHAMPQGGMGHWQRDVPVWFEYERQ